MRIGMDGLRAAVSAFASAALLQLKMLWFQIFFVGRMKFSSSESLTVPSENLCASIED